MKVIRVLVYEGDERFIETTFRMNAVKKHYQVSESCSITEYLEGYEYPRISDEDKARALRLVPKGREE